MDHELIILYIENDLASLGRRFAAQTIRRLGTESREATTDLSRPRRRVFLRRLGRAGLCDWPRNYLRFLENKLAKTRGFFILVRIRVWDLGLRFGIRA